MYSFIYFSFLRFFFSSTPITSLNLLSTFKSFLGMGRFTCLVDSKEGLESFRAWYRIPPRFAIRYCKEGQWHEERQEGEVVIPIIAFIEGGMRIPIGTVTRDYLRAHRLAPT